MRLLAPLVVALAASYSVVSAAECDANQQALVQSLDAQVLAGCPDVTDAASATSETVCVSSSCVELVATLLGQYPDCSVAGYEPKVVFGGAIAACSSGLVDAGSSGAPAESTVGSVAGSAGSADGSTGVGGGDSDGGDADAGDGGDESPDVGDSDAVASESGSASASGSSGAAAATATVSTAMAVALAAFSIAM